jgi:uncharacterized protein
MNDRSRYQLTDDLCLDARRALWVESQRLLAISDLHIGYAWTHRLAGQLMPLAHRNETLDRLRLLAEYYQPKQWVLLGDIVHRAVPLPAIKEELCNLFHALADGAELIAIAGNHDCKLQPLLHDCGLPSRVWTEFAAGDHLFTHGDCADAKTAAALLQKPIGGRLIMGHEHPAIRISGGVASSVKCPCFLAGPQAVILPAFSPWAAGSTFRLGRFMSACANSAQFTQAVAILGDKLLPVPLQQTSE